MAGCGWSPLLDALGYGRSSWPNLYREVKRKGYYGAVMRVAGELSTTPLVRELVRIKEESLEAAEDCLREVQDILHRAKLAGKCRYVEI